MKYLMLGESEELIKKAFGIKEEKNTKVNKTRVERLRKELECHVKEMLKEKTYA